MTPAQWRIVRQIQVILTAESGASFQELAERTGASFPEVRAVIWPLYGSKRADICHGYVVAPPRAAEERRAA
jgi:hypothetical protein